MLLTVSYTVLLCRPSFLDRSIRPFFLFFFIPEQTPLGHRYVLMNTEFLSSPGKSFKRGSRLLLFIATKYLEFEFVAQVNGDPSARFAQRPNDQQHLQHEPAA